MANGVGMCGVAWARAWQSVLSGACTVLLDQTCEPRAMSVSTFNTPGDRVYGLRCSGTHDWVAGQRFTLCGLQ